MVYQLPAPLFLPKGHYWLRCPRLTSFALKGLLFPFKDAKSWGSYWALDTEKEYIYLVYINTMISWYYTSGYLVVEFLLIYHSCRYCYYLVCMVKLWRLPTLMPTTSSTSPVLPFEICFKENLAGKPMQFSFFDDGNIWKPMISLGKKTFREIHWHRFLVGPGPCRCGDQSRLGPAEVLGTQIWIRRVEEQNCLVVWNIFFIFPYVGNNAPNWLSYFSEELKPPTRECLWFWWFRPKQVSCHPRLGEPYRDPLDSSYRCRNLKFFYFFIFFLIFLYGKTLTM